MSMSHPLNDPKNVIEDKRTPAIEEISHSFSGSLNNRPRNIGSSLDDT